MGERQSISSQFALHGWRALEQSYLSMPVFTQEKREGVQKSMGNKSSMEDWDADLSPCNFATTHFLAEPGPSKDFLTLRTLKNPGNKTQNSPKDQGISWQEKQQGN